MWLNGNSLEEINSRVRIVDIVEHPPDRDIELEDRAKYHGMHYLGTRINSRVIEVVFVIAARDKTLRRLLLEEVLALFDTNGELELSNRDGQYINVICTEAPSIDSHRDYMNTLKLEYISVDPFWQNRAPESATVNLAASVAGSVSISPTGNVDQSFMTFTLKNTSGGTINTFSIAVNGYGFSFTALGLAAGATLVCSYDSEGYLTLMIGATSVLSKRTGDDDLVLNQQEANTVTATASGTATLVVYARGLWK